MTIQENKWDTPALLIFPKAYPNSDFEPIQHSYQSGKADNSFEPNIPKSTDILYRKKCRHGFQQTILCETKRRMEKLLHIPR